MYRLNNAGTNKKSIIKQFYTKGLKPSNPDIDKALSGIWFMLLRYMISFCHRCGAVERFNIRLRKKNDDLYILSYTCPRCNYVNEMVAGKEDLDDLYSDRNLRSPQW